MPHWTFAICFQEFVSKQFLSKALHECVSKEKVNVLPFLLTLSQVCLQSIYCRVSAIWWCEFLKRITRIVACSDRTHLGQRNSVLHILFVAHYMCDCQRFVDSRRLFLTWLCDVALCSVARPVVDEAAAEAVDAGTAARAHTRTLRATDVITAHTPRLSHSARALHSFAK